MGDSDAPDLPNAVGVLLELGHRARHAATASELQFMAVNDSHALVPYRQAVLWLKAGGVACLSGVVQVEANVPYVQWLNDLCGQLEKTTKNASMVVAGDLPEQLGGEWAKWLPSHGLWIPLAGRAVQADGGASAEAGWLLARDLPWTDREILLIAEWADTWRHAWQALHRPPRWSWQDFRLRLQKLSRKPADGRWWKIPAVRWVLAVLAIALFPVHLTVLAPGELVPAHPAVIRAPLDGVIDTFHVRPNQLVKKDQPLFGFDEALIQARLEVTRQALATAEAEYRQTAQQALNDAKSKAQLVLLTGKIEEKRAEAAYGAEQMKRAQVLAPQDGIALFDDPSEWIGRPVTVGERIMRVATPADVEVEAWVPLADAIPLEAGADVSLYLNASPLSPVGAKLRYLAHDAVQRPDGSYAYRLRASLDDGTSHRVGLKGTAKLCGQWVTLGYWVLRRPLASVRAALGY